VVALADAPVIMDGTVQILSATGGSVRTGLNTFVQSAETKYVPHCHSASEEIFVILEGSGTFHAGDENTTCAQDMPSRAVRHRVAHWFVAGEGA
jgi:uncharacterized cupin superfamily protein